MKRSRRRHRVKKLISNQASRLSRPASPLVGSSPLTFDADPILAHRVDAPSLETLSLKLLSLNKLWGEPAGGGGRREPSQPSPSKREKSQPSTTLLYCGKNNLLYYYTQRASRRREITALYTISTVLIIESNVLGTLLVLVTC